MKMSFVRPVNPVMFLKAQFSSIVSTFADFLVTHFLTQALGIWYLASSVTGTVCGGVLNFTLGRRWVFQAKEDDRKIQILKYLTVWLGSLLLNSSGVYFFTETLKIHYLFSKAIVSVMVGVFYNYYFQKIFVFRNIAFSGSKKKEDDFIQ